jgi:hypothetical protein
LFPRKKINKYSAENNAEKEGSQTRAERAERDVFKYVKENVFALHQIKKVEHIKTP